MPTYEYACASCGSFDALRPMGQRDQPVAAFEQQRADGIGDQSKRRDAQHQRACDRRRM